MKVIAKDRLLKNIEVSRSGKEFAVVYDDDFIDIYEISSDEPLVEYIHSNT